MRYAGIDPGKKGAVAIFEDGFLANVHPLPYNKNGELDVRLFKVYLHNVKAVMLEQPVGMAQRRGMLTNFTNFGELKGICKLLVASVTICHPSTWKKFFNLSSDKEESIKLAKKLYPDVNLRRTRRSEREDDNIAEAILLGHYLWNRH